MKIFDKFEVLEPYPALYINSIEAIVISDLHLGLEELMTTSGVLFPRFQLEEIKEDLKNLIKEKEPKMLIITGDIKHEFSRVTWEERKEILDFLDFLSEKLEEIIILKGNHDNYLIYAVKHYPKVKLEDYFIIDKICFMHGHQKELTTQQLQANYFIMGNEHPAITLRDELGVKETIPCFVYGELDFGGKITVLPAFSKLSRGTPMNLVSQKDLLSPILKENVDFDNLSVLGISKELGLMNFPELGKLRQIS